MQMFNNGYLEKEFKGLYQVIISNLNQWNNCNKLKCYSCFYFWFECTFCGISRCKNCQLFKNNKDLLFEKCTQEQWDYVINLIYDLFDISIFSIQSYTDLKFINQKVKDKNKSIIFSSKNFNKKYVNNFNKNDKQHFIFKNKKRYYKR